MSMTRPDSRFVVSGLGVCTVEPRSIHRRSRTIVRPRRLLGYFVCWLVLLGVPSAGFSQATRGLDDDETLFEDVFQDPIGWSGQVELSYVLAKGNSETETLGFRGVLRRSWERSKFRLSLSGLRSENTQTQRAVVGTDVDDARLVERSQTALTAERYRLRARYEQRFYKNFLWYVGASWRQNEFSGIRSRASGVVGLGNQWIESDRTRFRTLYGLTFTNQDELIDRPDREDSFTGFRFSWELLRRLTFNSRFENELIFDQNLDESEDWRGELGSSVVVTMSRRLALKVSLELLYDNDRALTAVVRENATGEPTGDVVTVQLDELDTLFLVALVLDL